MRQRMRPASRPPYRSSSELRGGAATLRLGADCRLGLLAVDLGLSLPCAPAGCVLRRAVPRDFAAALRDRDAVEDLAVVPGPDVPADLAAPLLVRDDEPAFAVLRDLPAAVRGAASAVIFTDDIVLAAAVSDFAAVVMALVAVFIACMALDIVLADDVALVAAAVILVAADVTLVAADETVRAATAADGALPLAVVRVDLLAVVLVVGCVLGRLAVRLVVLPLADRVRLLAGVRRAAVRALVRAGTDLPPSRSITGVLFHPQQRFTHRWLSQLGNNGRKQRKIAANSPARARRAAAGSSRSSGCGAGTHLPPCAVRKGTAQRGAVPPVRWPGRGRQRQTVRSPPCPPRGESGLPRRFPWSTAGAGGLPQCAAAPPG